MKIEYKAFWTLLILSLIFGTLTFFGHRDNVNYTKTHPIGFTVIDTENAISRVQHKYSSELIGSHWISLDQN